MSREIGYSTHVEVKGRTCYKGGVEHVNNRKVTHRVSDIAEIMS